jgi:DNA-binding NarL/FixJ family response regulator
MTSRKKIRIVLADDHALVRQGLKAILDREADLQVVGEAADGREAVQMAATLRPDVVVMDVSMPRLNGIEATRRIVAESPDTRVIVVSMHVGEEYVFALLKAGARGYVLKESPVSEVIDAVRAVHDGGTCLHPKVSTQVVAGYLKQAGPRERLGELPDILTSREREVLQLIAEGHTNRAIAAELSLSIKTIEAHRTSIMSKLGVHNAAGLTRYAIRCGLIRSE